MESQLYLVTAERHQGRAWTRSPDHRHLREVSTATVVRGDLPHIALSFPLGFLRQEGQLRLAALLGPGPKTNLFVAPDGRWAGKYVPALLRAHPFRLVETGKGDFALAIDEAAGLIVDQDQGGTPFFKADGTPDPETQSVADFLVNTHRGLQAVQQAVNVLSELEVIEPWPLKFREADAERSVEGLGRVAETKLSALSGEQLMRLRDTGALPVAYAQLFSMGNIVVLGQMAQLHARHAAAAAQRMAIPAGSFVPESDGDLKIDWESLLKDK